MKTFLEKLLEKDIPDLSSEAKSLNEEFLNFIIKEHEIKTSSLDVIIDVLKTLLTINISIIIALISIPFLKATSSAIYLLIFLGIVELIFLIIALCNRNKITDDFINKSNKYTKLYGEIMRLFLIKINQISKKINKQIKIEKK